MISRKETCRLIEVYIIGMAIFISILLTVIGLAQQKWPNILPLGQWNILNNCSVFLIGCIGMLILSMYFVQRSLSFIIILLGTFIALITGGGLSLLKVVIYFISSASLGYTFTRLFRVPENLLGNVQYLLIGAGIYASVLSLSAHFPINYSWVYYSSFFVLIFFTRQWLLKELKELISFINCRRSSPGLQSIPKVLLGAYCLLYFSFAFFPEISFDALVTHLFVPMHIASKHFWGFDANLYTWTLMPMLGDWNYSIGCLLGGELAARLINIGFIYILLYLGKELVFWMGGNQKGVYWTMLLFLTTPLTVAESISLNVESIWSCYLVAGLICLLKGVSNPKYITSGIILAGIFLGFAAASKAVTLIYLPCFIGILFLCKTFFNKKFFWISLIIGGFFFFIIGSIPYLMAYCIAGNPVFPFYNAYFKSSLYPLENFNNALYNSGVTWGLPYQIIFESPKYMEGTVGSSGFQWLLLLMPSLLLACIFKNKRAVIVFFLGIISIIFVFHFQSYLRYIFPTFLIGSAFFGNALATPLQNNKLKLCLIIIGVITIGLNIFFFTSSIWGYRDLPLKQLINKKNLDALILTRCPIRKAVEEINLLNINNTPVLFFSLPFGAGLNADALYLGWYNPKLQAAFDKVNTAQTLAALLKKYKTEYIIVDSFWCGSSCTQQQYGSIEKATRVIVNFGTVSIRMLKKEYM